MAAGFTLEDAVTLEDVQAQGEALLLPTGSLFADSPILLLKTDREEKRVRCGNPITMPGIPDGTYRGLRSGPDVSLPLPGRKRNSDIHQEFLWSVTLCPSRKK